MNDKQRVAVHAASLVRDGMIIGLGTGSTANCFIDELAYLHSHKQLNITVVASSVVSAIKAHELGLPMLAIEQLTKLDYYVDGADEVTADLTLLKGRGSDLVKEKILARCCDSFLVLIDQSKQVSTIGEKFPIPIEVLPFAWQLVRQNIEKIGGHAVLRQNASADGLAVTSHGSLVLDVYFENQPDNKTLDLTLSNMPGVVEHGIFRDLATAVFIGANGGVQELWAQK